MQVNPNGAQLHAIAGAAAPAKPAQADAARFQAQLQASVATQKPAAPAATAAAQAPAPVQAASSADAAGQAQAAGRPAPRGSVLDIVV